MIDADGNSVRERYAGVVTTSPDETPGARLARIYKSVADLVAEWRPTEAGVESLYFARNASSAMPVAQARGVVLLALEHHGIPAAEYPPQAIKQAIVGTGRADKAQVQELVRVILGLTEIPKPDHAADALAAALCHFHSSAQQRILNREKGRTQG